MVLPTNIGLYWIGLPFVWHSEISNFDILECLQNKMLYKVTKALCSLAIWKHFSWELQPIFAICIFWQFAKWGSSLSILS
jgi:hypothetical protein